MRTVPPGLVPGTDAEIEALIQEARRRQRRRYLLTGVTAAVVLAGATGVTVSLLGPNSHSSANDLFHAPLAGAFVTPRPDQFVYSKVYINEVNWPGPEVDQSWQSVNGTRFGLQIQTLTAKGGSHFTWTYPVPVCVNGVQKLPPTYHLNLEKHVHPTCTAAAQFAGYLPSMPARPVALRAWMDKTYTIGPGRSHAIDLLWVTTLMTKVLTPAQRAAVYQMLAHTPGLTAVPTAATILGHPGVGVRWRLSTGRDKGSTYTLVFDRHTYQLLGMNWAGRLGMNGASGGEALVKLAVVKKAGQVP